MKRKRSNPIFPNVCLRMVSGAAIFAAVLFSSSCKKAPAASGGTEKERVALGKSAVANLAGSPVGDVVGKVTVGYQGWFSAAGDGSPLNSWGHTNLEMWPDTREYATTYSGTPFAQAGVYQPGYTGNLGNGQPAKMFSSYDQSTVNTHFLWMQKYGIDCVALQRFGSELGIPSLKSQRDGMATRVKNAAQTYGRKFYIMYDITSWTNFQTEIKTDWTNSMSTHTSSSAYAKQNGMPVVCIWGIGFTTRPGNVTSWTEVINWFKAQGCYVIVGTNGYFSTDTVNFPAYNAANMIMPWRVGYSSGFQTMNTNELNYCNTNGLDYQTDIYAGSAFYNTKGTGQNQFPRMHGDFMWTQFAAAKNAGVQSIYISMFDEFNEATQIMKTAENASMIPAGKYFLTLDADGVGCSSDFYLRLTNDGTKMIKGIIPYSATHPTPHTNYLDRADAATGWLSANPLTINTVDKKEGTGSLQSVGAGTDEFKKVFSPFSSGATTSGSIQFWYYVSDVTKFSAANQIEIGSGAAPDVNEYSWNIGTLVNGWNLITKTFSTATTTGGTPNLNAISWFRIYHAKTASITTRVDGIQILP